MKIDFRVDGGLAAFPGLAEPVTIECDALAPEEKEHLRALVRRADFFTRPPPSNPPRATPDARAYTIAIDDGPQCRTVTVREPIADPALLDLVGALRNRAAAARGAR